MDSIASYLDIATKITQLDAYAVLTNVCQVTASLIQPMVDKVLLALTGFWTRTLVKQPGPVGIV